MKVKLFIGSILVFAPVFVLIAQSSNPSTTNSSPVVPIVAAIIGAVLTQIGNYLFNRFKERKPRIIIEKNSSSLFTPFTIANKESPLLHITSATGNNYQFSNLFLITIQIQNRSSKDFSDFDFGLSVPDDYRFINIEGKSQGHLHKATFAPMVNFKETSSDIGVKLVPFNRKETYTITTYLTANDSNAKVPIVACDTTAPIDLIETIITKEKEERTRLSYWEAFGTTFLATLIGLVIYTAIQFKYTTMSMDAENYRHIFIDSLKINENKEKIKFLDQRQEIDSLKRLIENKNH